MYWIKLSAAVLLISLATVLMIDIIGNQFKSKINTFLPDYGFSRDEITSGYPIGHFKPDDVIGFDITPNLKVRASSKPWEYMPYDVWGNSYGCFDDEWSRDDLTGGIYLAGDSFTWGYARYEKKFGTLIENMLGVKTYACGVTHTGQGHQFEKFKRLFDKGLTPKLVIVNVYSNDIDNDYFFPHTNIIDGFMVENIERCGLASDPQFSYRRIPQNELESEIIKKRTEQKSIKNLLRQYSLTANIIAEFSRKLRHKVILATRNEQKSEERCLRWANAGLSAIGDKYDKSNLSAPNRRFISNWIKHSEINGYKLLFSFIPSKEPSKDISYSYVKEFIAANSGYYSSFDDFCDYNCRSLQEIYYRFDAHFNELGNQLYAEYLAEVIKDRITISR